MHFDLLADVAAIDNIAAVPTILEVVCRTTGMGFAVVARVTNDNWVACSVRDEIDFGLKTGSELKIDTTICYEILADGRHVVIDKVSDDPDYAKHHTPAMYGFESYISMPIRLADGTIFGTLCAIDPKPAKVNNPETIGMFRLFAELIAFNLDAAQKLAASKAKLLSEREASGQREQDAAQQLAASEAKLMTERETAELREEFIAVLGHDLRNPLASINAGLRLIGKTPLDDQAKDLIALMQNSVSRMSALIDNVLDFARGRLGGGLTLKRNADKPLADTLKQIIGELQISNPGRIIETRIDIGQPVNCDRSRIGQLFSNLLSNALIYGGSAPVKVTAAINNDHLVLTVANGGEPIAPGAMEKMFQPFSRGSVAPNQMGLGLGLYICSQIAAAHGGTLAVQSDARETRFTFTMPLGRPLSVSADGELLEV